MNSATFSISSELERVRTSAVSGVSSGSGTSVTRTSRARSINTWRIGSSRDVEFHDLDPRRTRRDTKGHEGWALPRTGAPSVRGERTPPPPSLRLPLAALSPQGEGRHVQRRCAVTKGAGAVCGEVFL